MSEGLEVIGEGQAEIFKVQTTLDGGARITINLGHESSDLVASLMAHKMRTNKLVRVVFIEEVKDGQTN